MNRIEQITVNCSLAITDSTRGNGNSNKNTVKAMRSVHTGIYSLGWTTAETNQIEKQIYLHINIYAHIHIYTYVYGYTCLHLCLYMCILLFLRYTYAVSWNNTSRFCCLLKILVTILEFLNGHFKADFYLICSIIVTGVTPSFKDEQI